MHLITPSILFLLAAIFFIYNRHPNKKAAYLASFCFVSSMLLYGFFYIANYFTGNGIDESVTFHLKSGLGGAGAAEYQGLIISTTIYIVAISVLSLKIFNLIKRQAGNSSGSGLWYAATASFIAASFITNPAVQDMYNVTSSAFAGESHSSKKDFPEEFISKSPSIKEKKNIVYIYLESVEATYLDEDLFPDLMPNIKALQRSATTFSNIQQVTHTGWTIAGMTASQCGIPLFSPSHGNSLSGLDKFLPEANCIGDILKKNGYHLSYMAGADLSFAGKGNFYQSHNFDSIKGKNELSQNLSDPENMSGWGLYDDSLFSMLKDEYSRLSASKTPFGLFTLTLDTHHPNGHISRSCKNIEYRDGSNPILNSVHCADALVKDLVDYINNNPGQNETVIVITSDHYAMKNTAWEDLNKGTRRNLFMVIDSELKEQGNTIEKQGSMLDVTPTLLSFLDTPIDGLGFGRNLNSDTPSLVETRDNINTYLTDQQGVVKYLWSYPKLNKGIDYSLEKEGHLLLGDREISLPAIIKLNDNANVDEIIFANSGRKKLGNYIEEMNIGRDFVWADQCRLINAFTYPAKADNNNNEWCIASGTTGANEVSAWSLADNTNISHDEIKDSLTSNDLHVDLHEKRVSQISNVLKYGAVNLETVSMSTASNMTGSAIVRSAGYGSGRSFIEQDGSRTHLKRGLTLVGLTNIHAPIKLSHIDSCGGAVADHDTLDDSGNFHAVIEEHSDSFDTFLIIGHDSVVCSDRELLNSSLSEIDIDKWDNIKLRQPYVAIISANGENKEFLGESEDSLTLEIKDFSKRSEPAEPPLSR